VTGVLGASGGLLLTDVTWKVGFDGGLWARIAAVVPALPLTASASAVDTERARDTTVANITRLFGRF